MSNLNIKTPVFRGSFVNILTPKAFSSEQDPKYSMVIAIDKNDPFWKELKKKMDEAAIQKFGEVPKKLKSFIKDGDDEDPKYGWQGKMVFTASNKNAPGVIIAQEGGGFSTVVAEDEIYSGAYYRASLRPYAYSYQNSKGVSISLENVLKVKDGEKFSSKVKAEDDFKDFLEDNSSSSDWD